jgi:outer membrane protein assembly factor BamB
VLVVVAAIALMASACDWSVVGGDAGNTKFQNEAASVVVNGRVVTLPHLDSGNVGSMHRHWVAPLPGCCGTRSTATTATIDGHQFAYVSSSNGSDGFVNKVDMSNGAVLWSAEDHSAGTFNFGGSSSSPLVMTIPNTSIVEVVIGSTDGHLYAFDARSGALRWIAFQGYSGLYPILSSPVETPGGQILVTSGQNTGGSTVEWGLFRFDANTGNPNGAWGLGAGTSLAAGNAYEASTPAIDGRTDTAFVNLPGLNPLGQGVCSVGVIAISGVSSSMNQVWEHQLSGNVCDAPSTPTVADGFVFDLTNNGLYELRESDGAELWRDPAPNSTYSSPAVANGLVFTGSDGGALRATRESGPGAVWSATGDTATAASPAVSRDLVIEMWGDGFVKAFPAASGPGPVWSVQDHGTASANVSISNGIVLVNGSDGTLRAFGP